MRHYFVREYVEKGVVKIIFVKSKLNTADIFTNGHNKELFLRQRSNIMDRKDHNE